jgi:LacI family transcriptional regulator
MSDSVPKRATIRDVARVAGVSTAAVSRWRSGTISLPAETVARITEAIDALGYEPNLHARRLSLGRTDTIALVVPDISDPFFAALAGAVEAAAEAQGLGLVLCSTLNRIDRELDYLNRLRRNHVDGLIFATNHADDGRLRAAIGGQPNVVLLDEDIEGTTVSKVFCDNDTGGHAATAHLVEQGHRRIGFIGGATRVMSAVERLAGYSRALAAVNVTVDPALVHFQGYTAEHGRAATRTLLSLPDRPTAIFASSDQIAIGALEMLSRHGLGVPRDISLVAYDDVAPFGLFAPAITAIRQPVAEMGRLGVDLLVAHLADAGKDPVQHRLPVQFMPRASVAPRGHAQTKATATTGAFP